MQRLYVSRFILLLFVHGPTMAYSFVFLYRTQRTHTISNRVLLHSTADTSTASTVATPPKNRPSDGMSPIHQEPTDAIIHLAPKAMIRLLELREKQCISSQQDQHSTPKPYLILRMGVRNGGCSGMSYVMDFATEDSITDEDQVDLYEKEGIKCVVDSKSMLYLYDMQLDYSDALIGGGFKFYNPNSQETCGCGSSFSI